MKICISFFQMLISIRRGGGLLKMAFPLLLATDKKRQIFSTEKHKTAEYIRFSDQKHRSEKFRQLNKSAGGNLLCT